VKEFNKAFFKFKGTFPVDARKENDELFKAMRL